MHTKLSEGLPEGNPTMSLSQRFQLLPREERKKRLSRLTNQELADLQYIWEWWGRPQQFLPDDDSWEVALMLPGRGWGKTRAISEWVRQRWQQGKMKNGALIADTPSDARDFNIDGPSGLLGVHAPYERPDIISTKARIVWPDKARMSWFSAEDPESIRGAGVDTVVIDELAKFKKQDDVMKQVDMILREGSDIKMVIATTPKPTPLIKDLYSDPKVLVIEGTTYENTHLNKRARERLEDKYAGTRYGQQELLGKVLMDQVGALWRNDLFKYIDDNEFSMEEFERIVIGVDPSGAGEKDQDEDDPNATGIVVAAKYRGANRLVILDDQSEVLSPEQWGRRVCDLAVKWGADKVVVERNFGGDMVRSTIQTVNPNLNVGMVTASRGKQLRAEPVSALYEQGKVTHLKPSKTYGTKGCATIEAQMCETTSEGYKGRGSPDSLDATVWCAFELLLEEQNEMLIL